MELVLRKVIFSIASKYRVLINQRRFTFFFFVMCTVSAGNIFPQSDTLDFYNLTLEQLANFKISSVTKAVQNINEVPSTIFIITSEELKEKGIFTLEEALSDLPGFQFRNIQGINSYIFQRGIPNQNNLTLLLIDGVQINELNSGGFYAGGQYNLSNVERIEIISGPASVAYGTNAVTGVINIITKSAMDKQAKLNVLAGSFNTFKGDFNYCYTDQKKTFGILFSGMYKKTNKADLKGVAGDNNWTDKMENFENDYSFDLKIQTGNFIFGTNYIQKQTSTSTLIKSVGTIYLDYGTLWNIRFINNYLKYHYDFSENLSFSSVLYNRNATVLDNTIYFVVDTAQIGYYRPNNLTGFENILNYSLSDVFGITGGLTLEFEKLAKSNTTSYSNSPKQKPPTPVKPEMLSNSLTSIFLEPRATLMQNLFLSCGVRFDQSSVYDQVLTPRAGLTYHYNSYIFRLSYAEAFRAPKPWDYTDGLGNSSLLPERMKSFETSLTSSVFENIKIDLIGYKNNLDKAIVKEVTNAGYKWVNSGAISTQGVELFFRYLSHNVKSSVNYTFTQSYNEFRQSVPEISKHTANASVTYLFNKYFTINLRTNYLGKRENPKLITSTNSKFIDPALIFHGAVTYKFYNSLDVQLIVKNIFNTKYFHTSNRDPDRYRQAQRTIMLSVGYALTE